MIILTEKVLTVDVVQDFMKSMVLLNAKNALQYVKLVMLPMINAQLVIQLL